MTQVAQNERYTIDAMELGPMENFIYLITDNHTHRAAVVDPAWDVPEILKLAEQRGVIITDILLTHSHHDHINGIEQVLAQFDAQLHLLKPEAEFWGQHLELPTLHQGGDIIRLGDTEIKVLHTPGHTPGHLSFFIPEHRLLFTADVDLTRFGPFYGHDFANINDFIIVYVC